jgi:large subunit ribosomal protein L21
MYAIIESGGKQYRVEKGDVIDVELLEAEGDKKVAFKQVLFLNTGEHSKIGAPHLPNVTVHAELVEEVKGPKVIAFKYKRRKPIRRKVGHRQRYARVKITEIGD